MFIQEEKWYGEGFGIKVQYIEMRYNITIAFH